MELQIGQKVKIVHFSTAAYIGDIGTVTKITPSLRYPLAVRLSPICKYGREIENVVNFDESELNQV